MGDTEHGKTKKRRKSNVPEMSIQRRKPCGVQGPLQPIGRAPSHNSSIPNKTDACPARSLPFFGPNRQAGVRWESEWGGWSVQKPVFPKPRGSVGLGGDPERSDDFMQGTSTVGAVVLVAVSVVSVAVAGCHSLFVIAKPEGRLSRSWCST